MSISCTQEGRGTSLNIQGSLMAALMWIYNKYKLCANSKKSGAEEVNIEMSNMKHGDTPTFTSATALTTIENPMVVMESSI